MKLVAPVCLALLTTLLFPAISFGEDLQLKLHLIEGARRATTADNTTPPRLADMQVILRQENGQWTDYGFAQATFFADTGESVGQYASIFAKNVYEVDVSSLERSGDRWTISFYVDLVPQDPNDRSHGYADYTVTIAPENGRLVGTFSGVTNGEELDGPAFPMSGEVRAVMEPTDLPKIDGHVPFVNGEHPRLIFRAGDIPTIRDRALNTPEGQRIMERLNASLPSSSWPTTDSDNFNREPGWYSAGAAFKYVVTDDPADAAEATRIVQVTMSNPEGGTPKFIRQNPRVMGVALAYDMMYNYWEANDPAFREEVAHFLEDRLEYFRPGNTTDYNNNIPSNHMGIRFGSMGVMAMAILGDEVRFIYDEPQLPLPEEGEFLPSEGAPAAGAPTSVLAAGVNDVIPRDWLFSGPFGPPAPTVDLLEAEGGSAAARPVPGMEATDGTTTHAFAALDPNSADDFYDRNGTVYLGIFRTLNRTSLATGLYYHVYEVQTEGFYQFDMQVFGLEVYTCWLAGKEIIDNEILYLKPGYYPFLLQAQAPTTDPWGRVGALPVFTYLSPQEVDDIVAAFNIEYAAWEALYNDYLAKGGVAYTAENHLRYATEGVRRWLHLGLGDQGWYNEGHGYLRFAITCGVGQFIQGMRVAMGIEMGTTTSAQAILPLATMAQVKGELLHYGPGGWPSLTEMYEERNGEWPIFFSSSREEDLPGLKWIFDEYLGLNGNRTFNILFPHNAAYAMANYPFDVTAENPTSHWRKTLIDWQHGLVAGRPGWDTSGPEHLTHVFLRSFPMRGTWDDSEGSDCRFYGFDTFLFSLHNALIAENNEIKYGGRLVDVRSSEDGSFVLKANMDDAYRAKKSGGKHADLGVRSTRWVGSDFSDASGVPGLYVIAENFTGATSPRLDLRNAAGISISGNTFSFSRSGVTVKGRVVLPASAALTRSGDKLRIGGGNEFLVVMTMDNTSSHPSIQVNGSPSFTGASVTVGGQTISFNGDALTFEQFNPVDASFRVDEIAKSSDDGFLQVGMTVDNDNRVVGRATDDLANGPWLNVGSVPVVRSGAKPIYVPVVTEDDEFSDFDKRGFFDGLGSDSHEDHPYWIRR